MTTSIEDRIYKLYSPATQTKILIAGGMIAILMPFTDTVYLPALDSVGESLDASETLVTLTISIYLGAVGVGQIFWGPLSDYFGRLNLLFSSLVVYEALTIGCIFANDITTLIVLRTFEGFVVGNTVVAVMAIISDSFEPEKRGTAMGAFLGPLLIGPIIAPLVGGALSQAFSWRATFVLLAIMTVPIAIAAWFLLPWETHHWWAQHRLAEAGQENADIIPAAAGATSTTNDNGGMKAAPAYNITTTDPAFLEEDKEGDVSSPSVNGGYSHMTVIDIEAGDNHKQLVADPPTNHGDSNSNKSVEDDSEQGIHPPELVNPLSLLVYLLEWEIAPTYWFAGTAFAAMFTSLTLLPLYLAKPPYSLSPSIVGVCFLPVGVAMLVGAVWGGMISDWAAVKYPASIDGRMYPNILLTWLVPIGCIGFGYSVDRGANLGAVLIAQSVLGFGQSIHMPAILNYLSAARPDNMGAVGAVSSFLNFALAAIVVSISVPIADAIGFANFFWILTGVTVGTLTWATWACKRNMHLGEMNPELKDERRNNSKKQRPTENGSSKSNKSGKSSNVNGASNRELIAMEAKVFPAAPQDQPDV